LQVGKSGICVLRQINIPLRQAVHIMRRQCDFDAVVHIEPLGMVIPLFGLNSDLRHEGESLREVDKNKFTGDGIALRVVLPIFKRSKQCYRGCGVYFSINFDSSCFDQCSIFGMLSLYKFGKFDGAEALGREAHFAEFVFVLGRVHDVSKRGGVFLNISV
jgi:hypothetical protein